MWIAATFLAGQSLGATEVPGVMRRRHVRLSLTRNRTVLSDGVDKAVKKLGKKPRFYNISGRETNKRQQS